ncbi:MAG: lysylphosphatidylglycerol synthase domain-containing protein [Candidatus Omnitrophica bacterium]|nr:lysylphosphatidylglycerol synthase domain-containing protein [Candidatus Omnitrophota bacterium]
MKKGLNYIGNFLTVTSLLFLFFRLSQYSNKFPSFSWNIQGIISIIGTILFCTLTIVVNAYIWKIILRGWKIFLSLKDSFEIVGQAQIGKYLPGNIFQYLSRISLGKKAGISMEVLLLSMGTETLILVLAAISIGSIGLFFDGKPPVRLIGKLNINESQFIILLIILITSFFGILLRKTRVWIYSCLRHTRKGGLITAFFLFIGVFIFYGVLISLLLSNLWKIETILKWYHFSWGFALAWLLGFITPGAPGGLGIRETVLYALYHHEIHEGTLIGLIFILRIIFGLGDLLGFTMAYIMKSKENSKRANLKGSPF